MALSYPILFVYGEDSYRPGIWYRQTSEKSTTRRNVTMREYYAYRIQQRTTEATTLVSAGKLFHQYIVDCYTAVEEGRLNWIRHNQGQLRSEVYQGLMDAIHRGDTDAKDIGRRTILPSSYTGSPRYRIQGYQDALAICRWGGYPDLFLTFTCNPKWSEIGYMLESIKGQPNHDRPDIIARVFHIKLQLLMQDIKVKEIFGRTIAVIYTIEFQKRGLPHAHILVFLHHEDKITSPLKIDQIISAEIPNLQEDPIGYEAVQNFMIHGPCGELNRESPCMKKKKCTKNFPRKFNQQTTIDEEGFPIYKRRNTGNIATKKGIKIDNRFVVPYNRDLLVKYQAHLNVEWCNRTRSIKYLFKYINKGSDRATIRVEAANQESEPQKETSKIKRDEIQAYLDCRYISASEGCWRLFQFEIQYREPSIERLSFHLPNEQNVIFDDSTNLQNLIERPGIECTMFTEWMKTNSQHEDARKLTYVDFPTEWVWQSNTKKWSRRKQGRKIGRIYYANPSSGERFYLRMLLNSVKGCQCYEDIRKVDGIVHPTFKAACYALGYLDDDREWDDCLKEAAIWATGQQLRNLFATILLFCEVTKPELLWKSNSNLLSEDVLYTQRKITQFDNLKLTKKQMSNFALMEIEEMLEAGGRSLKDYEGMPLPDEGFMKRMSNRLLLEEYNYDIEATTQEYERLARGMNEDQKRIFNIIIESVQQGQGKTIFVHGHGGTGKTYLWKTLLSRLRSESKIALAVASSGIAALLLEGGRTTHSRFHIPLNPTDGATCHIKKGTQLAELLKKTAMIIWDEAPMADKKCFEAVDRSLRDIMSKTIENAEEKPFGGITTVLGGDFKQILPVVTKGSREDIVQSCIKRSYLWDHVEVYNLKQNMRLKADRKTVSVQEFSEWMLQIGNGTTYHSMDSWVRLPEDLIVQPTENAIQTMVEATYPDISSSFTNTSYLKERAILAPTNEIVKGVNNYILDIIEGEETTFYSSDSLCASATTSVEEETLYPTEFLNSLSFPGIPDHKLRLKVGIPVMLLRNLNQNQGLCNGTRLTISQLGKWHVEALIITGTNTGQKVYIPRIIMTPAQSKWPFVLRRRQYPLAVCFAMTINKSQGQSLENVGLFLPQQVFTHGQLYVAVSRVTTRRGLKIMITDEESMDKATTMNIVYHEVLEGLT